MVTGELWSSPVIEEDRVVAFMDIAPPHEATCSSSRDRRKWGSSGLFQVHACSYPFLDGVSDSPRVGGRISCRVGPRYELAVRA